MSDLVGNHIAGFPTRRLIYSNLGPVDQNFVSLTLSLSPQFVNYIFVQKQIHCYFLLKECENPLHCKGFSHFFQQKITVDSHIFSTKNNCICNIAI